MSKVTVEILDGQCCGFGNCAQVCSEVFQLDRASNRVRLVPDAQFDAHVDRIATAVSECPTQALAMFADEEGCSDA